MEWGVHLPHLGRNLTRESLMTFAQECERLGAHSVWASDHLCWPTELASKYPYSHDGSFGVSPDMAWLEALGTLTFIAGCTERVRLGTSVLILPYRPPVLCAKQLATLDVLSGGRLILGAGVGWMAEEAAILGMPWDKRGKRSDERLEVFLTLFEDAAPSHAGEYYSFPAVGFEPKPLQDPLPIWMGGIPLLRTGGWRVSAMPFTLPSSLSRSSSSSGGKSGPSVKQWAGTPTKSSSRCGSIWIPVRRCRVINRLRARLSRCSRPYASSKRRESLTCSSIQLAAAVPRADWKWSVTSWKTWHLRRKTS